MRLRPLSLLGTIVVLFALLPLADAGSPPVRPGPLPWWVVSPPAIEAPAELAVAGGTWVRAYGSPSDEFAGIVRRTADSGFVLAGSTGGFLSGTSNLWIMKIDAAGNRLWEKAYGTPGDDFGSITAAATGGGYLIEATSYDDQFQVLAFTVGKLDANGVMQWQKKLLKDGLDTDILDFATPMTDGGFLASGFEFSLTSIPPVFNDVLVRISSTGSIVWQKGYARPLDAVFSGIPQELADHTILISGVKLTTTDPSNTDGWFRKLSSSGAVLWDKYIGGPAADVLIGVTPANGGGYIATGTTKSFVPVDDTQGNIWIVKLDTNGNVLLQKSFGSNGPDRGSLVALPDGYLLSGSTRPIGNDSSDIFVAKLDNNLNVVWAKTYDAGGTESGYATPDTSGGGYLLSGSVDSNGRAGDILVAKLDGSGNVVWARAYGGADFDAGGAFRLGSFPATTAAAQSLAFTDSDILLGGITRSFGAGGNDVLAGVLDSNGQIAGCPFIQNITLTVTPWALPVIVTTATVVTNTPAATDITGFTVADSILVTTIPTAATADGCNIVPALTAAAAADKTSGTAPLTVAFTGSATNGTPPYTWEWDFGDGTAKSTQQNPSHTYTDPGSFPVTLKVTDSAAKTATDTHLTIDVSGTCTLFCSSNVPATGTAGQLVTFQGSVESVSCSGSPAYSWTFGDSQTSSTQSPSHTYAAAGTFNWTLTVTQNGQSCSNNGSITIGGGVAQSVWWVPSIAHAPGAGGSKWRSNIAAVNRSGSTATLSLVFVPYSSGANVTKPYSLANGATVEWADVLVSLFAFADSANTKGTVKISSDKPIYAISRTYNQAASGTFGQYYPALIAAQGISGSQAAVLPLLKKNTAFRTNAGFQNLGSSSCTGEVKLFNATGVQVGSTRTLTAAADKYIQDDDVFTKAGAGTQDVAYARVQATTAGCKAWFFASVVDAVTNDPTTVPQQLSAAGPFWIPSIAHAPGAGSSKWRSNIAVVNRSGSTANLTLVFTPYAAGSTVTKTYTLANNNTVEWADVLVSLFAFADSANTKGTVKITSNVALFAISRTYNQAASGTFGQYYPALVASASITNGQSAVLPLLKKNTGFRTNAGFENLGDASCTGTVKLFNAAGVQVGTTRTLTAATDKYIQDDDVFTKAAAGNQEPAYALVEVTTVGGKAWFFASLVDAVTNDPTTIPQQ